MKQRLICKIGMFYVFFDFGRDQDREGKLKFFKSLISKRVPWFESLLVCGYYGIVSFSFASSNLAVQVIF
jgi:hypothetical protein